MREPQHRGQHHLDDPGARQGIYLDDEVVGRDPKGRRQIHADRIHPVGRLGAGEYVDFGRIIKLKRPA
jgi:hypothetical protein